MILKDLTIKIPKQAKDQSLQDWVGRAEIACRDAIHQHITEADQAYRKKTDRDALDPRPEPDPIPPAP